MPIIFAIWHAHTFDFCVLGVFSVYYTICHAIALWCMLCSPRLLLPGPAQRERDGFRPVPRGHFLHRRLCAPPRLRRGQLLPNWKRGAIVMPYGLILPLPVPKLHALPRRGVWERHKCVLCSVQWGLHGGVLLPIGKCKLECRDMSRGVLLPRGLGHAHAVPLR